MRRFYNCALRSVSGLTLAERAQMYSLLEAHFHNTHWETFCADLSNKDVVFLFLESRSSSLVGFSTQKLLVSSQGERVVFSGDTIIDPSAWGSLEFPRAWGLWMLNLYASDPWVPLYWLLISKGERTYRFLPTFFQDFSPRWNRQYSTAEAELILDIGRRLFGDALVLNEQGVFLVEADRQSQFLREHLVATVDDSRKDPDREFFFKVNSRYRQGTELVCLLRFEPDNMRSFCKRLLGLRALGASQGQENQ